MRMSKSLLLLALLVVCQTTTEAQTVKSWLKKAGQSVESYVHGEPWTFDGSLSTTHRETLLGVGQLGVIDQYISPTAHTGVDLKLVLGTDRPSFAKRWHLREELELGIGLPKNKSNGTTMYAPRLYGSIAPAYTLLERGSLRLEMAPAWSLLVQGNIKLSNTNNIANVKATTGLDAWSRLSYRIPWDPFPMRISYSVSLPLLHLSYHPEYGQSYYEYISGDNRMPIRLYVTSLHNSVSLRQRLLLELPIHNLTCLIGVQQEGTVERINHTKFEQGSVTLVLGVSLNTATLSGGRALRSRQVTSSY